jgi:hypothetical protein
VLDEFLACHVAEDRGLMLAYCLGSQGGYALSNSPVDLRSIIVPLTRIDEGSLYSRTMVAKTFLPFYECRCIWDDAGVSMWSA